MCSSNGSKDESGSVSNSVAAQSSSTAAPSSSSSKAESAKSDADADYETHVKKNEEVAKQYIDLYYNGKGGFRDLYSPKANVGQFGMPPMELVSIDKLEAVDINTVKYEVTYNVGFTEMEKTTNVGV